MAPQGTAAYDGLPDLPPLVERAVRLARREGFACSCRPEHGRLLFALAAGAELIGETGTGCGVGLAWLASGARPGTRLVSVERDAERARLSAELFPDLPQVTVMHGDWQEIYRDAPRRFFGAPARNVMWSNVAAHPGPVGDCAMKPTRTISAGSPERAK